MEGQCIESLLTEERIKKAFSSINSIDKLKVKDARYALILEDRCDDICAFMRDHFIPDEPVESSAGITCDEEYKANIKSAIREHLSLALVSQSTGDILGIRLIVIFKKPGLVINDFIDERARKVATLVKHLDNHCSIFDHYHVEKVFRFLALGVHRDFRQRGLGTKLMQAGVQFIRNLELQGVRVVIKGEGTSKYSNKIYEKLGFDHLASIEYYKYKVKGEVVFQNMGEHEFIKLYGKVIT